MKKSILIILLLVSLSACKEEETVSYQLLFHSVYPVESDFITYSNMIIRPNTSVKVYESELDYLLNQNLVHEGITDESGILRIKVNGQTEKYWYSFTKDTLNNLRFGDFTNDQSFGWSGSELNKEKVLYIRMSTTPTKLQINVTNNKLNPIANAEVQLYFSEQEFIDNQPAHFNLIEISKSYGNWTLASDISINYRLKPIFQSFTDNNGVAYFDNLEPRKYWIRVSSGALSNAQSVIETNGKLPDNPNITNTLSIMIQ